MKPQIVTLVFVFALFLITSCKVENTPDNFDYGKVEEGKYVNSYFDLEMTLPSDWSVQTQEQMENITKVGKDLVAGEDENMKAIVKASDVNTANLLAVFQYEYGSAVEFNPNFMVIAENIKRAPGIRSGKDYLFQSRKLLTQSQFQYDRIDEDFEKEIIDGTEFYKMKTEVNVMGINVRQVYYSTILKDFSFNVIISFSSDAQREDLLRVVQSMVFKK